MSEQLQNSDVAVASQPFQMPDWGIGRYERFAPDLEPAAEHVVELAGLHPGERVLDLGCGTGNAALLAARAGAAVTGIDPASRLLEIARERLAADGLDGSFVVGDAQALPFRDGEFDAVLSVFGVIFAARRRARPVGGDPGVETHGSNAHFCLAARRRTSTQ